MEASLLDVSQLLGPTTPVTSSDSVPVICAIDLAPAEQQTLTQQPDPAATAGDQLVGSKSTEECAFAAANDSFSALFTEQQLHQDQPQQEQMQEAQDEAVHEQHQQAAGVPALAQRPANPEPVQLQEQAGQQQESSTTCKNANPSVLPLCERVACLGQLLQQHGAAQGEANASIRLLLATISAKQVKTRKLLAGMAVSQQADISQPQHQQPVEQWQQQLQQLQQQFADSQAQLAASQSVLAAAQAELSQLKVEEAHQAELLYLREVEISELREAEQGYQTEITSLQEKLLEAQADLSRLSASLPGGRSRRRRDDCDTEEWKTAEDLMPDEDGFDNSPSAPAAGARKRFACAAAIDATAAAAGDAADGISIGAANGLSVAAGGLNFVTPAKSAKSVTQWSSLMTPDQQNIQQLKNWLHESQSALMKAQEDLMDSEALVKQLTQKLDQQQSEQRLDDQQEALQQQLQQQQRLLEELQSSAAAAEAAAESADKERNALKSELSELRAEISKLSIELQEAEAARIAAVQKLDLVAVTAASERTEGIDQSKQQSDAALGIAGIDSSAAAVAAAQQEAVAAAGRAAAAEAELAQARAAAAATAAEAAALQQQLKHLQGQQESAATGKEHATHAAPAEGGVAGGEEAQGPDTPYQQPTARDVHTAASPKEAATGGAATGEGTPRTFLDKEKQEPEGSVEYELLRAVSKNQALQSELAGTQQRMLLLLQLVKQAAAVAGKPQPQLPTELASILDGAAADASAAVSGGNDGQSSGKNSRYSAAACVGELADLAQLVSGLEQRYSRSQQLQNLLLHGKEMQFVLENALEQVHLLKSAARKDCRCPSEADYQQLAAATRGDSPAAAAAAAAQQARHSQSCAAERAQGAVATASAAAVGPAAAACAPGCRDVSELLHDEQYSAYHDGHSTVQHSADAGSSFLPGSPATDLYSLQQRQQQHHAGAVLTAPHYGSSCGSDVLRVGSGSSTATGAGLAPVDEGLGYDGLEGAWWNSSSIEPVTELPDFLKPKGA